HTLPEHKVERKTPRRRSFTLTRVTLPHRGCESLSHCVAALLRDPLHCRDLFTEDVVQARERASGLARLRLVGRRFWVWRGRQGNSWVWGRRQGVGWFWRRLGGGWRHALRLGERPR